MLKVSSRSFFTLVAVAAMIAAPAAFAQESDLSVVITDSADPADFDQLVDYVATYTNTGPDEANAPIMNLDVPPGQPFEVAGSWDRWRRTRQDVLAAST